MKVSHLIKVLEELNPDLDIFYLQNSGILAPIQSIRECHYIGFKPDYFVGICCGKTIDSGKILSNPIYVSQKKQSL